jgi:alpha-D-xyloside xylohydrolase
VKHSGDDGGLPGEDEGAAGDGFVEAAEEGFAAEENKEIEAEDGGWEYEGVPATEVGPTWRQQWIRTMTETLRELHGVGNFFLLSRSAWLGTPKFGHAVWSGDTSSSWEGFAQQIPTGLGAGLSG